MKNLSELLNSRTFSTSMLCLGGILIGLGIYNLKAKGKEGITNFGIGSGLLFAVLGAGYYLGRENGKRANQKNYQTKPEDYQNK